MWKQKLVPTTHGPRAMTYVKVGKDLGTGWSMPCTSICGKPLSRFHLTCLWCIPRRVYYKKVKPNRPVHVVVLPIYRAQNLYHLKRIVRKFLFTLIGWTLS